MRIKLTGSLFVFFMAVQFGITPVISKTTIPVVSSNEKSGKSDQAQILMRQGRFATAQKILKEAVKIHPFLRERSMIVKTPGRNL